MPSRLFLCLAIAILTGNCLHSAADVYEPPDGYYLNEDDEPLGTGETLKGELRTIVSTMTGVNYGNARFSAPYTDAAPDAGNVLLIYNRASVPATWDEGDTWNREHIWPVSRLGVSAPSNTTTNISTDQFNLRLDAAELGFEVVNALAERLRRRARLVERLFLPGIEDVWAGEPQTFGHRRCAVSVQEHLDRFAAKLFRVATTTSDWRNGLLPRHGTVLLRPRKLTSCTVH